MDLRRIRELMLEAMMRKAIEGKLSGVAVVATTSQLDLDVGLELIMRTVGDIDQHTLHDRRKKAFKSTADLLYMKREGYDVEFMGLILVGEYIAIAVFIEEKYNCHNFDISDMALRVFREEIENENRLVL